VDDVDAGADRLAQIFIVGSRFVCPCTMLFSIPCMLPTAGARMSIPVASTNSFAC
jgi:hypothetical protein